MSNHGSPVTLLKFQMAPKLMFLISSGSRKKEPRYACLSAGKASHSQRMRAEVSSLTPHLLHNGLSSSPSRWRCLLKVLCRVRRPATTLDCPYSIISSTLQCEGSIFSGKKNFYQTWRRYCNWSRISYIFSFEVQIKWTEYQSLDLRSNCGPENVGVNKKQGKLKMIFP